MAGKWRCPQASLLRYPYTQPEHAQDSCPWASQGSFPFLFLVGFRSASYIQIMRESLCCDNTNKKLQDTSSCSEMRPLPAASQQNQNENMTLTAAGNFNIFFCLSVAVQGLSVFPWAAQILCIYDLAVQGQYRLSLGVKHTPLGSNHPLVLLWTTAVVIMVWSFHNLH